MTTENKREILDKLLRKIDEPEDYRTQKYVDTIIYTACETDYIGFKLLSADALTVWALVEYAMKHMTDEEFQKIRL